jgi:quercetin dioxygenase-like cupin family protein
MTTTTGTEPQLIDDPLHGVAYRFEREGDNLWVHTTMRPGGHLPEHFHPIQEERWEALEGAVRLKLDGTWRDLRAGDGPAVVVPGARHELENVSDRDAVLRTEVLPAGHLEDFLTESAWAAREGLYYEKSLPTSLRGAGWLARFALAHRAETVMTSPPPIVQRLTLPLAARLLPTPR